MPKKFWDYLSARYDFISAIVHLLIVFLFVELHAFGSNFTVATISLVALIALVAFDWCLKRHRERYIMRQLHSEFIDSLLEAAAKSISRVTDVNHMRASLMVKEDNALIITNCYNFAEGDQDRSIRVLLGTGVAGRAWVEERVIIADLRQRLLARQPGDPDWSIVEPEDRKVRETLNSIMSVPIKGGRPYRMLAVLNIDSDHPMDETRFFERDIQNIAYCFYKALVSLLDKTD